MVYFINQHTLIVAVALAVKVLLGVVQKQVNFEVVRRLFTLDDVFVELVVVDVPLSEI